MKKKLQSSRFQLHLLRKSKRKKAKKLKILKGENTKKHREYKRLLQKYNEKLKLWDKDRREKYQKVFYKPKSYDEPLKVVKINQPIGVEQRADFYIDRAKELISGNSKEISLDIRDCNRVWPSAVMLLCSYLHWTRLTTLESTPLPKISSSLSKNKNVSSYLDFCGFHDYVNRAKSGVPCQYKDDEVVKIQRESSAKAFDSRFDEISSLIEKQGVFDSDQLEEFKSMILGEILLNVTEHGINYQDIGWYTLTQYHPSSGIISMNIADNGVGFEGTLSTGPQKLKFKNPVRAEYVEAALKENVSGAFEAPIKKGFLVRSHEYGEKRGNGLTRIAEACKELGIKLTIASHNEFYSREPNGTEKSIYSAEKLFAGTLYNLLIPAKSNVQVSHEA